MRCDLGAPAGVAAAVHGAAGQSHRGAAGNAERRRRLNGMRLIAIVLVWVEGRALGLDLGCHGANARHEPHTETGRGSCDDGITQKARIRTRHAGCNDDGCSSDSGSSSRTQIPAGVQLMMAHAHCVDSRADANEAPCTLSASGRRNEEKKKCQVSGPDKRICRGWASWIRSSSIDRAFTSNACMHACTARLVRGCSLEPLWEHHNANLDSRGGLKLRLGWNFLFLF